MCLVSQGGHTNCHKLGGLKQQKLVLSQFWSQSEKSGCRRAALPWGSREAPACPFQLSRAPVCSWPRGSSMHVS